MLFRVASFGGIGQVKLGSRGPNVPLFRIPSMPSETLLLSPNHEFVRGLEHPWPSSVPDKNRCGVHAWWKRTGLNAIIALDSTHDRYAHLNP
jgi:hypothetical protein